MVGASNYARNSLSQEVLRMTRTQIQALLILSQVLEPLSSPTSNPNSASDG